jgi:ribosome-associated protein
MLSVSVNKKNESLQLLDVISQAIFDKKGQNILALDVRGISTMADFYLIAEGSVERHVKALHNAILDAMQQNGHRVLHVEGVRESDWVVLDFGDIVIHLFIPELREKYALETLWNEGKVVDVKINTEKPVLPGSTS